MALRNPPFCEDKILPDGKMIAIHSMSLISTIVRLDDVMERNVYRLSPPSP